MIVVASTSPIYYLVLIGEIDVFPQLFERAIVPQAVCNELNAQGVPAQLQNWIAQPPAWLEIQSVVNEPDANLERLHPGEWQAILLAEQVGADLLVLDNKAARQIAVARGFKVTSLLGLLDEAATQGSIELSGAIERLRRTTFRVSPTLLKSLLERHPEANLQVDGER
jgi:predicted nucleic acid-binding protein